MRSSTLGFGEIIFKDLHRSTYIRITTFTLGTDNYILLHDDINLKPTYYTIILVPRTYKIVDNFIIIIIIM